MANETSPLDAPVLTPKNGDNNSLSNNTVSQAVLDARGDGLMNQVVTAQNAKSGDGFLTTMASSISKDDEYRQELKTANFSSPKKAMEWVLALAECEDCGISVKEVVNVLLATKAGINGALLHELMQAYSHFSFDTGYTKDKNKWKDKNPDAASSSSPIA